jgi:hypothetical protein
MQSPGVQGAGVSVPDFHRVRTGRKPENLKNWISDIQITGPTQQDFRFSLFHLLPGYDESVVSIG